MDEPRPKLQPVHLSVIGLLGAVAGALLIAGTITWLAVTWLSPGAEGRLGFMAGTFASVIAGFASVVPLILGAHFGAMGVVGGYFAGSFVRAILAIGICLAAIRWRDCPPVPTLLTMVVHYLAVLTAESIIVGRALLNRPL